jgi:DNA-binding winged helix-turn-helix (wHTH) protein
MFSGSKLTEEVWKAEIALARKLRKIIYGIRKLPKK